MGTYDGRFKLISRNWQYAVISISKAGAPWDIPGPEWAHVRGEVERLAQRHGVHVVSADWFFQELGHHKVMVPQHQWDMPGLLDAFHHSDKGNCGFALTFDQYFLECVQFVIAVGEAKWKKSLVE